MDRLPNHLWCDILELTPQAHVTAWMFASHATFCGMQGRRVTVKKGETVHAASLALARLCQSSLVLSDSHNMLLWAAKNAHMRALQFLKAWGWGPIVRKNIQACDSAVVSACAYAMTWAAQFGHVCVIQVLQDWAFDLTGTRYTLHTLPLAQMVRSAVTHGQVQVLQYLESLGHEVNHSTLENDILPKAISYGHVSILQHYQAHTNILLRVLDNVSFWHHPLVNAVWCNNVPMIQYLRSQGLTIQHLRAEHDRILHVATHQNCVHLWGMFKSWEDTCCECLDAPELEHGRRLVTRLEPVGFDRLSVQDLRRNDNTLLALAARVGNLDMLQFLRDWIDPDGGCLTMEDVRTRDNTALWHAAFNGHVEACRMLRDWRWDKEAPTNTMCGFPDRLTSVDAIFCLRLSRDTSSRERVVHTLQQVFDFMDAVE